MSPPPDPYAAAYATYAALYPKGQQAIVNNQAFLANGSPTNADVLAQVRALTRQTNAVLRLLLGLLDTTDGT